MKKYIHCLLSLLALAPVATNAQIANIVESPEYSIHCDSSCTTIHADLVKPLLTSSYITSTVPYVPNTVPGATTLSIPDDKFSGAVPIGFTFCFYQAQYTNVYISDNGHITFNASYSGQSSSFDTETPLPYTNSAFPDNAIFSPFMDLSPSAGGTIKYGTIGVAPFRKFVVQYSNVKLFGPSCSAGTSSFEVVLYETTNIIDIFITNKTTCDESGDNWRNYATLGVQSIGAVSSTTVPGRNATIWTASNEGWRIAPNGLPAYNIKWTNVGTGVMVGTKDSVRVCGTYPMKVALRYELTCPNVVVHDTVLIEKNLPEIVPDIIRPSCPTDSTGVIVLNVVPADNPPYLYSLAGSPLSPLNVFTGLPAGFYLATVVDGSGCQSTKLIEVKPLNLLTFLPTITKAHCPDDNGIISVAVGGGTPPYTFTWDTGDTGPVLDSCAGDSTYTVTVTDGSGCEFKWPVTMTEDSLPNIYSSVTRPICRDSGGIIINNVFGGTPPYTYAWTPASLGTSPSLYNIPAGDYSFKVVDANGCTSYRDFFVLDTLNVDTEMDSVGTICGGANGSADPNAFGGIPPYTYLWSNGTTLPTLENVTGGLYWVTITDNSECAYTDTVYIPGSPVLNVNLYPANAHCDSNNGVINSTLENPTGPYTYTWSNGGEGTYLEDLAPGVYSVTVTDSLGCVDTASVTIGDDGVPHLKILEYMPPLCYGDSTGIVTLGGVSGVAPYKYSLDGSTFTTVAEVHNISGGEYTIYIRDANSCLTDTTLTFAQPPKIEATFTELDTLRCYEDRIPFVTVFATGGFRPYEYRLNTGSFIPDSTFYNLGHEHIFVEIRDSNNCVMAVPLQIPMPSSSLNINFIREDLDCYEENTGKLTAQVTGGWAPLKYEWYELYTETGPTLDSLAPGKFILTVTDDKGCVDTATEEVFQRQCCTASVPSAFSPNNDGLNDKLKVISISDITSMDFKVYNRFGNLVFQTSDLNSGWDGKYKGTDQGIDTYFYYLRYRCPFFHKDVEVSGDVTLIR